MNQEKDIFDKEWQAKPVIFLKGIGRYCVVCHKHIFPRQYNQVTCSKKCRERKRSMKRRTEKEVTGIHAFINIKKYGEKKTYRIMKLYLKKGVIEEIRITPDMKELWEKLDKIENFRNVKIPFVEIVA